ncbi:hypothetical protein D3C86_1824220 [compost metagenome]
MKIVFEPGVLTYGGNVRFSQLLALLIIIAAITMIIIRRKKGYSNERYADPIVSRLAVEKNTLVKEEETDKGVNYDSNRTI